MHDPSIPSSSPSCATAQGSPTARAADLVRRQARLLHRASHSERVSVALPALRRLHAAGIFPGQGLATLFSQRQRMQRKHFLRALAIEAGFADWEHFRPALDRMPVEAFDHFEVSEHGFAFLNAWFSNEAQARAYAAVHGGKVVRFGAQAVVVERCESEPAA